MDYSWIKGGRISLVCVGSELNGDDAFGHRLYEKLGKLDEDNIQVLFTATAPENFIDEIMEFNPEEIAVFDAADYGGRPGELREVSVSELEAVTFSTHRAPMKLFHNYFKEKGVPVRFIGVQVKQTTLGGGLSSEVEETVDEVCVGINSALRRQHPGQ